MSLTRRTFAAASAAAVSSLGADAPMPTRVLGKTGARVSVLAFGGGSRFLMYQTEEEAAAALQKAMDLGITYFDNAYGYGDGKSEARYGRILKPHRKRLFLVTKTNDRTYDGTMRLVEGSMKRMALDQLDLLHIHSLNGADDLAAIEAENGCLKAMYKLREQKMTRFIGITCHNTPDVLRTALERHDFDCTQMALNAARIGNSGARPNSFEEVALPVALRKNMGVLAMKIFGQEKLTGKAPIDQLIRYSLSLPVAACVLGMPRLEYIDANVAVAKSFTPMSSMERDALFRRLEPQKLAMDHYFADHVDC